MSPEEFVSYSYTDNSTKDKVRKMRGYDPRRSISMSRPSFNGDEKDREGFKLEYDTEQNSYILSVVILTVDGIFVRELKESQKICARFLDTTSTMEVVDKDSLIRCAELSSFTSIVLAKFFKVAYDAAKNPQCAKHIEEMYYNMNGYANSTILANLIIHYNNMDAIEAIGESMLCALDSKEFELSTTFGKRHQILGLPKKITSWIAKTQSDYSKSVFTSEFQKMMRDDPNELIAIVDYLDMQQEKLIKIIKKGKRKAEYSPLDGSSLELVSALSKIREVDDSLDLRRVLNYCVKQKLLQSHNKNVTGIGNGFRYLVAIPSAQAKTYADYLKTSPKEKFPSNLVKAHNAAMLEIEISPTEEDIQKFKAYGENLSKTHNHEYKKDDKVFHFKVPTNYEEFLEIGRMFQNCLPLCGSSFFSGLCDIVFVYENDDTIPKYALETDKMGFVSQAKQKHDLDIEEEFAMQAVIHYERWLIKNLNSPLM